MTERERMLAGLAYWAGEDSLVGARRRARRLMARINQTLPEQEEERQALFRELLGKTGDAFYIEPPFICDYGSQISLGEDFYANFECLILDTCPVVIGDHVMFGPRVSVYTACHPVDAAVRIRGLELGKPVFIGNCVWVGGSTVINPGVTIGDNTVIGSGSVVTKSIPSGVVAAGNPCRVIREITEEEKLFWLEWEQQYQNSGHGAGFSLSGRELSE